ncbi:MAG: hypothetical protein AAB928_01970, partial [Patescibacteria group bacterium]
GLEPAGARIKFDESFTSIISETEPIKVIVTPTTRLNGSLYVHEKTRFGFEVREINAYDEGGMFDWMVVARKKGGEEVQSNSSVPSEPSAPVEPVTTPAEPIAPVEPAPTEPAPTETATTTEPAPSEVVTPPADTTATTTDSTSSPPAEPITTP